MELSYESKRILHATRSYSISGDEPETGREKARLWNNLYGPRGWKAEYIPGKTVERSITILWKPESTTLKRELEEIERDLVRAI